MLGHDREHGHGMRGQKTFSGQIAWHAELLTQLDGADADVAPPASMISFVLGRPRQRIRDLPGLTTAASKYAGTVGRGRVVWHVIKSFALFRSPLGNVT